MEFKNTAMRKIWFLRVIFFGGTKIPASFLTHLLNLKEEKGNIAKPTLFSALSLVQISYQHKGGSLVSQMKSKHKFDLHRLKQ